MDSLKGFVVRVVSSDIMYLKSPYISECFLNKSVAERVGGEQETLHFGRLPVDDMPQSTFY